MTELAFEHPPIFPGISFGERTAALPRSDEPGLAAIPETILVVDDEEAVRELVSDILVLGGYTVLTAGSGAEALSVLAAHAEPVHLLLSDVVMPGMSGPSLAACLLPIRPEIRVLFMSGYAGDDFFRRGLEAESHPFLDKPFSAGELRRMVRAVLDRPAGAQR